MASAITEYTEAGLMDVLANDCGHASYEDAVKHEPVMEGEYMRFKLSYGADGNAKLKQARPLTHKIDYAKLGLTNHVAVEDAPEPAQAGEDELTAVSVIRWW